MATVATDNFNRASLGANWTLTDGTMVIVSSVDCSCNTLSAQCVARWNANTFANDQYVQFKLSALSGDGSKIDGNVRIDTGGALTYYMIRIATNGFELWKRIAGTFTQLQTAVGTPAVNDIVRLEARGSVLTGKQNGATLFTITDTAIAGGAPGIGGFSNTQTNRGDDWEGGNLDAVGGGGHTQVLQSLERPIHSI